MNVKRCNLCGNVIDPMTGRGGIHISEELGYGSKYDMDLLDMEICYECLDRIVDACRISPVRPYDT